MKRRILFLLIVALCAGCYYSAGTEAMLNRQGADLASADAQMRYDFPGWNISQGTKVRVIKDDAWGGDNVRIYILEGDAKNHSVVIPRSGLVSIGRW